MQTKESAKIEAEVRAWTKEFVIGLNLCPFAKGPFDKGRVRISVCDSTDRQEAYRTFLTELELLVGQEVDELETTLLVFPSLFADFDDYLDFMDVAEDSIAEADLEGVAQVASFHPDYRFEDVDPEDVTNYTNRSPYPILHLLLEDSITAAVDGHPDIDGIPERNMQLMREMGLEKVRTLLKNIQENAGRES